MSYVKLNSFFYVEKVAMQVDILAAVHFGCCLKCHFKTMGIRELVLPNHFLFWQDFPLVVGMLAAVGICRHRDSRTSVKSGADVGKWVWLDICVPIHPKGVQWGSGLAFMEESYMSSMLKADLFRSTENVCLRRLYTRLYSTVRIGCRGKSISF